MTRPTNGLTSISDARLAISVGGQSASVANLIESYIKVVELARECREARVGLGVVQGLLPFQMAARRAKATESALDAALSQITTGPHPQSSREDHSARTGGGAPDYQIVNARGEKETA